MLPEDEAPWDSVDRVLSVCEELPLHRTQGTDDKTPGAIGGWVLHAGVTAAVGVQLGSMFVVGDASGIGAIVDDEGLLVVNQSGYPTCAEASDTTLKPTQHLEEDSEEENDDVRCEQTAISATVVKLIKKK